jgi:hypothetical protein
MKKGNKTITQMIIDALMTGKTLKSGDIAEMITEKKVSVKDISSTLSKIRDKKRYPLGHFIERKQDEGRTFVYRMVSEALKLSSNQAYGLTLKTGELKYTLEQALQDFPELRKYADSKTSESEKKPAAKPVKAAQPKKKAEKKKKDGKKAAPAPVKKTAPVPVKKDKPASVSKPADDTAKMLADVIQKIADGDLNINLNLSVKLEK